MRTLSVNEVAEAIGLMAGVLTTLSFLPQVRQTWRTKSTKDISLPMLLSFCTGVLLWLVYGIMISSLPVMLANGVTFVLSGAILMMKLKWG
jgi:MtN3 and saliva related transmembrane protein